MEHKKSKKKMAFVTDLHLDESFPNNGIDARRNWEVILADISSNGIHEIVIGGDIGESTSYKWFFETLHKYDLNIILGNHDKFEEAQKYFRKELPENQRELYYATEDEYFKTIYLDSSAESISPEQLKWFCKQIITSKRILLFIHHPILEINTAVDKMYPLKDRDKIKKELLKLENEVWIFCGHCHMPDERREKNIHQFVTIAASFQIEKNKEVIQINSKMFGYRILKIEEDEIRNKLVVFRNEQFS